MKDGRLGLPLAITFYTQVCSLGFSNNSNMPLSELYKNEHLVGTFWFKTYIPLQQGIPSLVSFNMFYCLP